MASAKVTLRAPLHLDEGDQAGAASDQVNLAGLGLDPLCHHPPSGLREEHGGLGLPLAPALVSVAAAFGTAALAHSPFNSSARA